MSAPMIHITPTAYNRIEDVRTERGNMGLYLRIGVSGGGCSGFRYDLSWDEQIQDSDLAIDDVVLVDDVSLPLLMGATIDYETGLMGQRFTVTNPNATSGCGCGESFAV